MTDVSALCFRRQQQMAAGMPKQGDVTVQPRFLPTARFKGITSYRELVRLAKDGGLQDWERKALKEWYEWIRDNPGLRDSWMCDLFHAANELREEPK